MKNNRDIIIVAIMVLTLFGIFHYKYGALSKNKDQDALTSASLNENRPMLKDEGEEYDPNEIDKKNRSWTKDDAVEHEQIINEKIDNLNKNLTRSNRNGYVSLANGAVTGKWINRGPYNMPGAWNTATIEVGTDTVYATTCGHYGGVNIIYKGTIRNAANTSGGDDFVLLKGSGRFTQKWQDLNVIRSGGVKYIIGTVQNGRVYYSDDDGKNWIPSSGLPSMLYNTVIDRKNSKVYTTDGQNIYKSDDFGVTFSQFVNLGASQISRVYTPMFDIQPGYGTLYVMHGNTFKKVVGTTVTSMGSISGGTVENKAFNIAGDTRRFYVSTWNSKYGSDGTKKVLYWTSTNEGVNWTQKFPTGHYYSNVCEMSSGLNFGVSPVDPNYVIGGYAHPCVSNDGLNTVKENYQQWGWYQGNQGSVSTQQPTLRKYYHPDFQSTHFWIDKEGEEFSCWVSDGGILISRVAHLGDNITDCERYGYYNANLQGGSAVTETYDWGMVCGHRNPTDFALGTQDQGIQNSQSGLINEMVQVIQSPGGDGEACASGPDGEYGWSIGNSKIKRPFPLYKNSSFNWSKERGGAEYSITVKNIWHDLKDYSNTLWVLNGELNKVVWNGSSFSKTTKSFGNSGNVAAMCQSPSNKTLFWVLDNNKVYKSTNSGSTFGTPITVPMSASSNGKNVRGWAFNDNIILFAGKSENSFTSIVSTDGGATFTTVDGFPNIDVRWMQGDNDGTIAMASTKTGPYIFDVDQMKWFDAAGDLDNGSPFFDGQWGSYIPSLNLFRFSTWGFGIWDFELDNNMPKISINASPDGGIINAGEIINIKWTTNQSGTVIIDLMHNGIKIKNLGSVSHTDDNFNWLVDSDLTNGDGYTLKLTLGNVSAISSEFVIMPNLTLIPQTNISIVSFDSEHDNSSNAAANVLDGDVGTIWHTSYAAGAPQYPHEIVFKINDISIENLLAFSYTPRKDGENGTVKDYEVYVSSNGSLWKSVCSGSFSGLSDEEIVLLDIAQAGDDSRFIKFEAQSEINGNIWTSMSEFNLYCDTFDAVGNKLMNVSKNNKSLTLIAGNKIKITLPQSQNIKLILFELNGRKVLEKNLNLNAGISLIDIEQENLATKQYVIKMVGKYGVLSKKIIIK